MARLETAERERKKGAPIPPPSMLGIVSTKTQKVVDAIKKPFLSFAKEFGSLVQTREELSPKFMRAFGLWASETNGTFVTFVRTLDPSIPENREGYRGHRTYQAAEYLRRLQARGPRIRKERPEDAAVSPIGMLARTVASVLPMVDATAFWQAFIAEARWTPRQVTRFQSLVATAKPITAASRLLAAGARIH